MGGTRIAVIHQQNILYIAFRGSAGTNDWRDNTHLGLVDLPGQEGGAKVHRGFNERAERIIKDVIFYGSLLSPEKTIVLTGHSLGAALSQVVYIQLKDYIKSKTNSKIINISFGGPMVGNSALRRQLGEDKTSGSGHWVFVLLSL